MLKQLRQKKVMKKVLWVLAIIIIPAFVLWGAGGLRESGHYAGKIFGEKISFSEYRNSYTAVKNRGLLRFGSKFYSMYDDKKLSDEAWDNLIMLKEAKRAGIKVSNKEVVGSIALMPLFQNKDGSFNNTTYNMLLRSVFNTEARQFEEEIRGALAIEKLLAQAIGPASEPSEEEIEKAMKLGTGKQKEKSTEKNGEETKTILEEKRRRAVAALTMIKKGEAYKTWIESLRKKAGLISNIGTEREETPEKISEGTPVKEASSSEEKSEKSPFKNKEAVSGN